MTYHQRMYTHTEISRTGVGLIFQNGILQRNGSSLSSILIAPTQGFQMRQNNSHMCRLSAAYLYFTVFPICFLIKFYLQIRFFIIKHNFKYYMVYDSLGKKKALNQNTSSLMPKLNSTRNKQQHIVSTGMLYEVWELSSLD